MGALGECGGAGRQSSVQPSPLTGSRSTGRPDTLPAGAMDLKARNEIATLGTGLTSQNSVLIQLIAPNSYVMLAIIDGFALRLPTQ